MHGNELGRNREAQLTMFPDQIEEVAGRVEVFIGGKVRFLVLVQPRQIPVAQGLIAFDDQLH